MARAAVRLDPARTGREAAALAENLRSRVVGQDDAIRQVVEVYQTFVAGLSAPGRPVGSFLFLGPTGSGKTRLVEAVAESLAGDAAAAIKIDCAEFQHSHEIAKLIGSPPGYLGHRETPPLLTQEALDKRRDDAVKLSFVLFDEIEKASDALWNLMLAILDKATLTLGDNRRVDFSRAMIFMTGNLGAAEMSSILRPGMGFAAAGAQGAAPPDAALEAKISRAGVEAARRRFTAEFMNRIDKIVVFRPLGDAELNRILDLELEIVRRRILESAAAPFAFSLTPPAREFLLREGTDMRYGARHLKRAIDRHLLSPLSSLIASDQARRGDRISVGFDAGAERLLFLRTARGLPEAGTESLSAAA